MWAWKAIEEVGGQVLALVMFGAFVVAGTWLLEKGKR
jgi:hypothetical protein